MRDWTFEPGDGQTVKRGKANWPDMLTLDLRDQDVAAVMARAARQIERHEAVGPLTLSVCGRMTGGHPVSAGFSEAERALLDLLNRIDTQGKSLPDDMRTEVEQTLSEAHARGWRAS